MSSVPGAGGHTLAVFGGRFVTAGSTLASVSGQSSDESPNLEYFDTLTSEWLTPTRVDGPTPPGKLTTPVVQLLSFTPGDVKVRLGLQLSLLHLAITIRHQRSALGFLDVSTTRTPVSITISVSILCRTSPLSCCGRGPSKACSR